MGMFRVVGGGREGATGLIAVDDVGACEGFGGGRDVGIVCGGGLKRSTSGSGSAFGGGRLRREELT